MSRIIKKRRVCFVITSFIHYSRSIFILEELNKRSDIELDVVIAGTALLSKYSSVYGQVRSILERDGFKNLHELYFNLEGDTHVVKAKTAGLGIIEFATMFNDLKPDLVVVRGDRFEILAAATAASYMNITIAHIEGGDLSGTIDESVRHAVTKLSHIHFTTNEDSRRRVVQMGESKKYVFNFGSPEIEVVRRLANGKPRVDLAKTGSGYQVDLNRGYVMVLYHPVVTDNDVIAERTKLILEVIHSLDLQTIWFWPNFDAGAETISSVLRGFNNKVSGHKVHFMRYLPPKEFISLLANTKCLIGNSSAGIKECSYLGVPVVNVGTRQKGRLRDKNVLDVDYDTTLIKRVIKKQLHIGRYPRSKIYLANNTAKKITEKIASIPLYTQKKFVI